ncbi:MAG: uracil-DNA glycosylase [Clostridiales bacterium]|nr:uracil-DNA glycosylase [Clostridiales bacterium]MDY2834340.1 uracil-DNA glycosylase [Candidatus Aphodomonas sp.]
MLVSWPTLTEEITRCQKCRLCAGRTYPVPGEGNPHARLMFIGEGPGRDEDQTGRPFVGRAGQLLDKMIGAIGLSREEVFIANVVKCRPPQNRAPEADEVAACMPYLRAQVGLIRPQVIVLLGSSALGAILGPDHRITRERGAWIERKGVWFMPTFHPAALLRDESKKRPVWEDLKKVRDKLQELQADEPNA